jgi:DedD protein
MQFARPLQNPLICEHHSGAYIKVCEQRSAINQGIMQGIVELRTDPNNLRLIEMPVKHRLVGIIVIVALAMILIPIFMNHTQSDPDTLQLSSKVPSPPAKPSIGLVIPPESQTLPQALPLQRAIEKELTPEEEPPASAEAPKEMAAIPPVPAPQIQAAAPVTMPKKTTTAKKITPVPAQAWVIKLGTFSDKNNASNLVKKLKANGFTAYMHESDTSQGKLVSVFVGPNVQRNLAEQTAQRLEKLFNLKGMVVKYKI